MTIPVLWMAQDDGRGRFNCTATLNDMLDNYDCIHVPAKGFDFDVSSFRDFRHAMHHSTDGFSGGVLIIHGGRQIGSIDRVNMVLDDLKWAVVVVLGDEENSFPIEKIEHKNMRLWIQEPAIPGKHSGLKARYLLDGYTPHTHGFTGFARDPHERDLDWVFAGQVTHRRRWECVAALERMDWGGIEIRTRGYCQGVSIQEYYSLLNRALIVPCPSGPFSQDAARPWEALCMGAVPILDDLSPTRTEAGFWKAVLGEHPLPTVTDWNILPQLIAEIKADWPRINDRCQKWWENYQADFNTWLARDIEELSV
jgi:hypothetical protein